MKLFLICLSLLFVECCGHGHGHSHGHSSHGHSSHGHSVFHSHYIGVSLITHYSLYNHFISHIRTNFYNNELYYNYTITHYGNFDKEKKECIYYKISQNYNNETVINLNNVEIINNFTLFNDLNQNNLSYCINHFDWSILISFVYFILLIVFLSCFCCLFEECIEKYKRNRNCLLY